MGFLSGFRIYERPRPQQIADEILNNPGSQLVHSVIRTSCLRSTTDRP